MKIEHKDNLLKVEGKYYRVVDIDGKHTFEQVNKKKVEKKANLVKKLASKLKDNLDREIVMKEALTNLSLEELERLDKMVKSERKYKPKTREGACADMKVGNFIIPIVA